MLSGNFIRNLIFRLTKIVEFATPFDRLKFSFYKLVIGNFFAAGFRDGSKRFGTKP
jgi:hypothetical protein